MMWPAALWFLLGSTIGLFVASLACCAGRADERIERLRDDWDEHA